MSTFFTPYEIQEPKEPAKLFSRPVPEEVGKQADTAETMIVDIPRDNFIHAISICIGDSTTATATVRGTPGDYIDEVELIVNGSHVIKHMLGVQCKEISHIIERTNPSDGYYKIFMHDPRIPGSKPFPSFAKGITDLKLKILTTGGTGSGTKYEHIRVTLLEEKPLGQDISKFPILVEKIRKHAHFGTDTTWCKYEHPRAYKVYGYIYTLDDNDTIEAPSEASGKWDKLRIIGRHPGGEVRILDECHMVEMVELATLQYQNAPETGNVIVEFLQGLDTTKYTNVDSELYPTAAQTNGGVRVLERYLLGG